MVNTRANSRESSPVRQERNDDNANNDANDVAVDSVNNDANVAVDNGAFNESKAIEDLRDRQERFELSMSASMVNLQQSLSALLTQVSHLQPVPVATSPAVEEASSLPSVSSASPSATKVPGLPKKQLESWTGHPNDKPAEFERFMEKAVRFQQYYKLTDEAAVKELQWVANPVLHLRIDCCRSSYPHESFAALCKRLTTLALPPASVANDRFRELRRLQQLVGESGESFARRFEVVAAEYGRAAQLSPTELATESYRQFCASLNETYLVEMRDSFSSTGSLGVITDPFFRWQAALRDIRAIACRPHHKTNERTFDELRASTTRRSTSSATHQQVPVNLLTGRTPDWRCRTCETNEHDWKTCDKALAKSYCRKCRQKCHPTFLHDQVTAAQATGATTIPVNAIEVGEAAASDAGVAANPAADDS